MITTELRFTVPQAYPLTRLGEPGGLLFFDIETTGFSGDCHAVYLIGCAFFRDGQWQIRQWFADAPDAEGEVLAAFFAFAGDFTTLVHFNGDRFDIPFLSKRADAWGQSWDPSAFASADLYRRIRPCRKLLGLDSLKQRSIEQFLGIFRQDPYSGGQLTDVYQMYLQTHEASLYEALMLHNREDLEQMPAILPILYYADFGRQEFTLKSQKVVQQPDIFGKSAFRLRLALEGSDALPTPVQWETPRSSCQAFENQLELDIPLFDGTLKHFHPDYKDYYYLVYEDMAVHKSVGEYVEKSARKKATAQTCYVKKNSLFLPQPDTLWEPAFKKSYRDRQLYAEYGPELFRDQKILTEYVHDLLEI